MPSNDHRESSPLYEIAATTAQATYLFCRQFGIFDGHLRLGFNPGHPSPLAMEVHRWSDDDAEPSRSWTAGAPALPYARFDVSHGQLRADLVADLRRLTRACAFRLGPHEFDLSFGQSELTIRRGGLRGFQFSRIILLEEIPGLEKLAEAVKCATAPRGKKRE